MKVIARIDCEDELGFQNIESNGEVEVLNWNADVLVEYRNLSLKIPGEYFSDKSQGYNLVLITDEKYEELNQLEKMAKQ